MFGGAMPATLKSRLPQIIAEMEPEISGAMRVGAELIEGRAKERVPDAPPVGEGLVAAIHVEEADDGYSVVAGDSKHFYGHFLEYGTKRAAAHPFLVPAKEESEDEVLGLVQAVLGGL